MKIYCVLFLGAFSNPAKRDAEEIECPARCWEKVYNSDTSAYECVPEATKVIFQKIAQKKYYQNFTKRKKTILEQKISQNLHKQYYKM